MKWFSDLFSELSETGSEPKKQNLIFHFFRESDPNEKMHGLFLLLNGKLKRPVSSAILREFISRQAGIRSWLLTESEKSTGNLAETLTLLVNDPEKSSEVSLKTLFLFCETCRQLPSEALSEFLSANWKSFTRSQRLLANHLLCGSFKSDFPTVLIIGLFAKATNLNPALLLCLLAEKWHPDTFSFDQLKALPMPGFHIPFPVISPQMVISRTLPSGVPENWHAEWKPSGTEVQLVKISGKVFLFDAEGSLILKGFLDLIRAGHFLPDGTILSGTAVNSGNYFFKNISEENRILNDGISTSIPKKPDFVLICSDIFAYNGSLLIEEEFSNRRVLLETCLQKIQPSSLFLSEAVSFQYWDELSDLMKSQFPPETEGILLRSLDQNDLSGKLVKPEHHLIKTVLLYAQSTQNSSHGGYDLLTMAVRKDENLISVGKVVNSLPENEKNELSRFIRSNTIERFGPVRTVKPELVFEIGFDSVVPSGRHKSGLALNAAFLVRWMHEADSDEVCRLSHLEEMAKKSLRTRDTEA